MKTEYKVRSYPVSTPDVISRDLSQWAEDGWEPIESWRFYAPGTHRVAFLLEKKPHRPEPVTFSSDLEEER